MAESSRQTEKAPQRDELKRASFSSIAESINSVVLLRNIRQNPKILEKSEWAENIQTYVDRMLKHYRNDQIMDYLLWKSINDDFDEFTEQHWKAIRSEQWASIKKLLIAQKIWIDHHEHKRKRHEIMQRIVNTPYHVLNGRHVITITKPGLSAFSPKWLIWSNSPQPRHLTNAQRYGIIIKYCYVIRSIWKQREGGEYGEDSMAKGLYS